MYKQIFWFELAALVCAFLAFPVIWKNKALRIYPFLLLLIVCVEGYFRFFPQPTAINARTYNIQVPLQYLLYLLILYFASTGHRLKAFIVAAIVLNTVANIVTIYYFTAGDAYNVWGYCASSLLLIIAIIGKFYEMLQMPADLNFLKNPLFYMLFAYLLFNLITLPYFSMANWLHHKRYRVLASSLAIVMSILNFVLYTTYSIAFLWIVRKKAI